MRRVSYHQSVFDLLDLRPAASEPARQRVEACEGRYGRRLPEAVRQWYLIDDVVALTPAEGEEGHLWYDYSNMDHPEPLETVLRGFAGVWSPNHDPEEPQRVRVLVENQGVCSWFLELDGSDDPPVVVDEWYQWEKDSPDGQSRILEWHRTAEHFSDFLLNWFAAFYTEDWTPLSERDYSPSRRTRPPRPKPYRNGLWLFSHDDPALLPPFLDFLIEELTEDGREQVAGGVTQYRFHNDHGQVRVTTDDHREPGGVAAWWLHARSRKALLALAAPLWWCGELRQTLRPGSDKARPVLDRLRKLRRP
jgi:hypothetical protein